MIDARIRLPGMELKNPVIAASGCFGYGREFARFYNISMLGGIAIKSITSDRRFGNETPRIAEAPAGMLNAIGLQNAGVDVVIRDEFPWLETLHTNIIANIAGSTEDEYLDVIKALNDHDVIKAYELNVSCPNVSHGGMSFGKDPKIVAQLTKKAKEIAKKPIYVKLTPNVDNIVEIAKAAEEAGADGLVLVNTFLATRIDIKTRRPVLANITGGLSGPAIKPLALRIVYDVYKAVKIPIIGVGGIATANDVIEFMMAGATAVQVGAQNLSDPMACKKIVDELPFVMKDLGIERLEDIIGVANE